MPESKAIIPAFVVIDDPKVRAKVLRSLTAAGFTPFEVTDLKSLLIHPQRYAIRMLMADTRTIKEQGQSGWERFITREFDLPLATPLQALTIIVFYQGDNGYDQRRYCGGRRFIELAAVCADTPDAELAEFVKQHFSEPQRRERR